MSDELETEARRNEVDTDLQAEIELRAYFKYCQRGCAPGCDVDDWLAAEQEILTERAAVSAPRTTDMSESPADEGGVRGRERASNRTKK